MESEGKAFTHGLAEPAEQALPNPGGRIYLVVQHENNAVR